MSKKERIIWMVLTLLLTAALSVGMASKEEEETVEPAATQVYDTTYLERWDNGGEQGVIRMVGAWFYNYEPSNNTTVLEDESGHLWVVRDVTIDENDFLLLWIDNNVTPDYIEDDIVVKTWREAR